VTASPDRPIVVLACAGDDAAAMAPVIRGLVAQGVRVDVVAGIDVDVRPLEAALDRNSSRALYVVCDTEALDGRQLDVLRLAAQCSGVDHHHLAILPFAGHAPEVFVASLQPRLSRLGFVGYAPSQPRSTRRATQAISARPVPAPVAAPPVAAPLAAAPTIATAPTPIPPSRESSTDSIVVAPEIAVGATMRAPVPARRRRLAIAGLAAAVAIALVGAVASASEEQPQPGPATPAIAPLPEAVEPELAAVASPERSAAPTAARAPARIADAMVQAPPVAEALASRRIRALDLLLVAPLQGSSRHRDASARCRDLREANLAGWRLPTPDETAALGAAGVIASDTWWWTRTGKKSARVVWDGDSSHRQNPGKRTVAQVVCVVEDRTPTAPR
jgi:hypothetical protein